MPGKQSSDFDELAASLKHGDAKERWTAAEKLGQFGEQATPALVEALKDGEFLVRFEAARALADQRHPAALQVMSEELTSSDPGNRRLAIRCLSRFGAQAIPSLSFALNDENTITRLEALQYLNRGFSQPSDYEQLVSSLIHLVRYEEDSRVLTEAQILLARVKGYDFLDSVRAEVFNYSAIDSINKQKRQHRLSESESHIKPSSSLVDQHTPAAALKALSATWPEDYEGRATALADTHLAYRQELATQLEPIVNARIKQAIESGTSYDQKKELVKQLNEELRLGGLAVACEVRDDSGLSRDYPGIFVIGTARHEGGRFRVEHHEPTGKKTVGLPSGAEIRLMPAPTQHGRDLDGPDSASFADRVTARRSDPAKNRR